MTQDGQYLLAAEPICVASAASPCVSRRRLLPKRDGRDAQLGADARGVCVVRGRWAGVLQALEQLIDRAPGGIVGCDGLDGGVALAEAIAHHVAPEFQPGDIRFRATCPGALEVEHG